ncbi:hypothetical protein EI94DRAFT_134391 [Lactarius quietus]|nr:hypothetical protein EI94DRAFT_134391 [Lactarius quietus]
MYCMKPASSLPDQSPSLSVQVSPEHLTIKNCNATINLFGKRCLPRGSTQQFGCGIREVRPRSGSLRDDAGVRAMTVCLLCHTPPTAEGDRCSSRHSVRLSHRRPTLPETRVRRFYSDLDEEFSGDHGRGWEDVYERDAVIEQESPSGTRATRTRTATFLCSSSRGNCVTPEGASRLFLCPSPVHVLD